MKKTQKVKIMDRPLYDVDMMAQRDIEFHLERDVSSRGKAVKVEVYHIRPVVTHNHHQFV